jgi:hypothetical protein
MKSNWIMGNLAYLVHPLESVATISVLIDPAIRSTVIREEHQASVVALRSVAKKIKGSVVIEQEVLGVASLRADDIRSLDGVTTEEDREVESDNVVVALAGVKLDRETSRVTSLIWKLPAKGDSRETNEGRCLLAGTLEEVCLGHVGHICSGLKVSKSTRAARVDHSLEVLGAVESLLLLHEEDIRHERNAANVLAVCWVRERVALIVGEVGRIVFPLAAGDLARDFGDDYELLVSIHCTMYRLYLLSAGPSLALCICDMRGARPSGSDVLIELIVSSAFFLIGKESINGGKRSTNDGTTATGFLCARSPTPPLSHTIGEPLRQTAYLTR